MEVSVSPTPEVFVASLEFLLYSLVLAVRVTAKRGIRNSQIQVFI